MYTKPATIQPKKPPSKPTKGKLKKEGKELNIPYWRTLKTGGFLNEKYPGGAEAHIRLLEREGFKIIQKGRKFVVDNYEKHLIDM